MSLILCCLQGSIRYEITGLYPSPTFFELNVENDRAHVMLAKDLRTDSLQLTEYQVKLKAYPISYPDQFVETTLVVTVTRNDYGPTFQPSSNYEQPLVASFPVGDEVLTVSAIDRDELVSTGNSRYMKRFFDFPSSSICIIYTFIFRILSATLLIMLQICVWISSFWKSEQEYSEQRQHLTKLLRNVMLVLCGNQNNCLFSSNTNEYYLNTSY